MRFQLLLRSVFLCFVVFMMAAKYKGRCVIFFFMYFLLRQSVFEFLGGGARGLSFSLLL